MIEVGFSSSFQRAFKRRIKGKAALEARFWERMEIFQNNPFDQRLRTHKLSGRLNDLWSFTIEYDVPVVFSLEGESALLALHKKSKIQYEFKYRVTLKALANVSPGFALKPWVQNARDVVRNPEGVAGLRLTTTGATLSELRRREMCSFPRVAKAQPWADISQRFQRYLLSGLEKSGC